MKLAGRIVVLFSFGAASLLLSLPSDACGQFSVLHEFTGGPSDGRTPAGQLVLSGNTLFGVTRQGGDANQGTVFRLNVDGTGFTLLHEFAGGASDGGNPFGGLLLSGNTLYGTTRAGGDNGAGTVFKLNTDGTSYGVLHEFAGGASDGSNPETKLALVGSTLFGTTPAGGDSNRGTVFKVNADGSAFSLLHEFAGGVDDGHAPKGGLAFDGSTLYGTTNLGGSTGGPGATGTGILFKIDPDGSDFSILQRFVTGTLRFPENDLILAGSRLFGTTLQVSGGEAGNVFAINTDGTGLTSLHEFTTAAHDGTFPSGSLALIGGTLFGTTENLKDLGTVFRVNMDGSQFATLFESLQNGPDGFPLGGVAISNSVIYGMTEFGSDYPQGAIFALTIPEPSSASLALCGLAIVALSVRRAKQFQN